MPKKLTDLDAATALADADQFVIEQGGTSKRISTVTAAATAAAKGFAELATQAEVDAGADAERIITPATLLGSPAAAFLRLYHAQEHQAADTDSVTALADATAVARRDLVEVVDTLGVAGAGGGSVGGANNTQITLPAGTYWIEASAPCYAAGEESGVSVAASLADVEHKLALYNVTDTAYAVDGQSEYLGLSTALTDSGGGSTEYAAAGGIARIAGKFTIAGTKVFELRHFVNYTVLQGAMDVTLGGGRATNYDSWTEIYADISIWQLAVG